MKRNYSSLKVVMSSKNIKGNSDTLALVTFEEKDSPSVEITSHALAIFPSTK